MAFLSRPGTVPVFQSSGLYGTQNLTPGPRTPNAERHGTPQSRSTCGAAARGARASGARRCRAGKGGDKHKLLRPNRSPLPGPSFFWTPPN